MLDHFERYDDLCTRTRQWYSLVEVMLDELHVRTHSVIARRVYTNARVKTAAQTREHRAGTTADVQQRAAIRAACIQRALRSVVDCCGARTTRRCDPLCQRHLSPRAHATLCCAPRSSTRCSCASCCAGSHNCAARSGAARARRSRSCGSSSNRRNARASPLTSLCATRTPQLSSTISARPPASLTTAGTPL